MDDITIGVTEFVNNILVSAQPNDQTIDITVTETVETVLLDVSTTVQEVTVTATQNVIVENITVDYVNNENNIDINVTDGTQDVTLNVTPTLVEINILRSGGEVNILQFNTLADFPATGSSDYFYLAKDTNKLYRWTGSAYAEISATANAVWGQIIGTLSEQTDLNNALNLKAPINSPTFTGTVSGITKTMVGLGAVDNTSDLDKPISTATQTALNNKQPLDGDLTSIAALSGTFGLLKKTANNSYTIDTNTYLTGITSSDVTTALGFTPENVANKGIANGYASLNGDGKVPSSQLPSYVDDVIEVSSFGTLPTTGETGKIYITLDTNKIYRWSGSVYVEVSSSAAVWGGITGTLSAQTDLQSALNAKENTITAGTTAQYYRGDKTFQTLDTSVVPEGSNLYFTDARVNANGNVTANTAARHNAVTLGTANGLSLSTQVLSLGVASGSTTGALSSTDWTTFNNKYPASNPNGYTSNVGTVTSVAMTVPSAFSVSGSPITSSGTLAVTATGNTTQYIAGDGSLVTFPTMSTAGTLIREVRNTTGATLTKGTVVYISGATGNKPTVSKAIATGDSTSAQTFGLVQADIANNANGNVVCAGDITGIDTSALTEGAQLYLSSTTAGAYTTTKQYAPAHLVYIGIVTRAHPSLGQIEVNIQNGYELDELHNVAAQTPSNNDGLFYETSTSLWKNKSIATVLGYTPANGADYMALSGDQTIAGLKTFSGFALFDHNIFIKQGTDTSFLSGYNVIDATASSIFLGLPNTFGANLVLSSLTTQRNFTFPDAAGTIALTSQLHDAVTIGTANGLSLSTQVLSLGLASTSTTGALSSTDWNTFNGKQSALGYTAANDANVVHLTGNESISGNKVFTTQLSAAQLRFSETGNFGQVAGFTQIGGTADYFNFVNGNNTKQATFTYGTGGSGYSYTLPSTSGTLALTSALSAYQLLLTNPITGTGTTSYLPKFTGTSAIGNSLLYDTGSVLLVGATSASDGQSKLELVSAGTVGLKIISSGANGNNTFLSIQSSKEWRFVTNRGDLIGGNQGDLIIRNNTDGINHIILNQGGSTTFAGALNGTSATFSGNVTLTGTDSRIPGGDSAGRLVVGNSSTSTYGIFYGATHATSANVIFFANNSAPTLTLNANNTATFSSSVTAGAILTNGASGTAGQEAIRINNNNGYIGFFNSANSTRSGYIQGNTTDLTIASSLSTPLIFSTANAEKMRITSAGNVGINTSTPNEKLQIDNGAISLRKNDGTFGSLRFGTTQTTWLDAWAGIESDWEGVGVNVANLKFFTSFGVRNERMRITSGGSVLVGTTDSSGLEKMIAINSTNNAGYKISVNGSVRGYVFADASTYYIESANSTRIRVWVNSANGVYLDAGNTSWTSNSDERLKTALTPITDALNKVSQLRSVIGRFKTDEESVKRSFLIAQDVQSVLPEAINIDKETGMLGVQYTEVIPLLVASIKELKSKIETLENK